MKKKIYIITGSRADYGLMQILINKFDKDKDIELKIFVTGMHLSSKFGNTYREILQDGFRIEKKVKILNSSDTPTAISKSTGLGIMRFAPLFDTATPDLLVVLGDRYEIMSAVIAANFHQIPVAHIGGGDTTLGAVDEWIRHSITKMSWLHFVSNPLSKKRVIQLGENPKRVFITGSLGVDRLMNIKLLSKKSIEKKMKFKFNKKNILITYHPVTLEKNTSASQFKEILSAVSKLKDTKLIFTYPNSDTFGRIIINMIKKFVSLKKYDSIKFSSMGHINYLSVLKNVDCILGNSSSGLIEAPSIKIPTINIGDRQKGRLKANSVIDSKPMESLITKSIKKIHSKKFRKNLKYTRNPYEYKNSSHKVYRIIKNTIIPFELKKLFYDL
jgi:GDP/UDP-N,N'-diacetylbacillosamine 2-epimerase (hydrolysing)